MATNTITVYPASYDQSNYSYASVNSSHPLSNPIGKGSDNDTYSEWNMKTGSNAESHVFYKFDLSQIPSNATIDSVSCSAKGYISSTSSFYINSRTMQMYYGTSTAKGSSVDLTTSASAQDISCGTWTREELNDCRIRIYSKRSRFSASTSRTARFYGATLTVTYTVPDDGPILYLKEDGIWNAYSTVYKKANGIWVQQSDLESVLNSTAKYVKKN